MKRTNGIIATPSSIQNAVIYSYFHFLFDLTEKNPDETEFVFHIPATKRCFLPLNPHHSVSLPIKKSFLFVNQ